MLNCEFRVVYRGDEKIKQYRNTDIEDDEWKDVSVDEHRKYNKPERCSDTQDMFDKKDESLT